MKVGDRRQPKKSAMDDKDEKPVLVFKFCDQTLCNGQCGYFWSDGRRATWGEPCG